MKAILQHQTGDASQLYLGTAPDLQTGPRDILIRNHATALNRADILQREGHYPPPPGASDILGLEAAGEVIEVGAAVSQWKVGDRVCALLPGGGYAQQVVIPEALAMAIPDGLTYQQAAAIPEVFLTAYQAMFWLADLQAGERILIHAGASGVGTAAIQLAKRKGAEVFITASAGKHELCRQLGADHCIDYKKENFAERVNEATDKKGVAVVIDFIGAPYLEKNMSSLATDGRIVSLAMMGGRTAESFSLIPMLRKRIKWMGSTLRARSLDYKSRLVNDFQKDCWAAFAEGALKPVVDSVYSWQQVAEAHQYMEANRNQGKIILTID